MGSPKLHSLGRNRVEGKALTWNSSTILSTTVLPGETSGIEFKVDPGLQLPLGAWQNNPHIHLKPQNITANTYLFFFPQFKITRITRK